MRKMKNERLSKKVLDGYHREEGRGVTNEYSRKSRVRILMNRRKFNEAWKIKLSGCQVAVNGQVISSYLIKMKLTSLERGKKWTINER